MATLTKAEWEKANAKMENGFRLDAQFYCLWNEKTAVKVLDLENGHRLEIRIDYIDKARRLYSSDSSIDMVISFHEWEPARTAGLWASYGTGHHFTISTGHTKKMFNKIQAETFNWPDEKCLKCWNTILTTGAPSSLNGLLETIA